MFHSPISYNEARKLDNILYELCIYDVSNGQMLSFEEPEEIMDLQKQIADRFNLYKRLIQLGEVTFEELISDITARNSAINYSYTEVNNENIEDKIAEWEEEMIFHDIRKKVQEVLQNETLKMQKQHPFNIPKQHEEQEQKKTLFTTILDKLKENFLFEKIMEMLNVTDKKNKHREHKG